MRAQNQAYLAAAGYSNTGYSNTGGTILPNLGRTTRISFPTEDESSIGRRTMKRGLGSTLLPGVLAYLTDSDLPMLVDRTSKKRSGRGAAAAVKDDELADAKLATAAGMSNGKAFDKIIEKEAIAAAGESSKTNAAEDAGEDLAEEGADSGSEEGEGAASGSDDEAAPPAPVAAVGGGGAAAAAIAAELRAEEAAAPAAAAEGGAEEGAAEAAPGVMVIPPPGMTTEAGYLTPGSKSGIIKAQAINTILGEAVFGSTKVSARGHIIQPVSDDKAVLAALKLRLEAKRNSYNTEGDKPLRKLMAKALSALQTKINAPLYTGGAVGGAL